MTIRQNPMTLLKERKTSGLWNGRSAFYSGKIPAMGKAIREKSEEKRSRVS